MVSLLAGFQSSWQNIHAARGFDITVVGMLITFSALATISLCIAAVPHLLVVVNKVMPEKVETPKAKVSPASVTDDIVVAIGLAYHSLRSANK